MPYPTGRGRVGDLYTYVCCNMICTYVSACMCIIVLRALVGVFVSANWYCILPMYNVVSNVLDSLVLCSYLL